MHNTETYKECSTSNTDSHDSVWLSLMLEITSK